MNINLEDHHELFKKAILKFGRTHQISQAIEEFAECIVVLRHYERKRVPFVNIISEIVDMAIMLEQLSIIYRREIAEFKSEHDIQDVIDYKINKLQNHVDKGEKNGI